MAVKIQYPGVADGIDSDINNLVTILNATRLVPDALFLDELVRVARKELAWEVNYIREKEASNHFRKLLANDPVFYVPEIYEDLSSARVLTSEFLEGLCSLCFLFIVGRNARLLCMFMFGFCTVSVHLSMISYHNDYLYC